MAENKQYVKQTQEDGALLISEDVITTIVAHAVSEVEGVVSLVAKSSDNSDKSGKKNLNKVIKIQIINNTAVRIDCNITIYYGASVVTIAKAAQDAIISAIEAMTNVKVKSVNVNIGGIVHK